MYAQGFVVIERHWTRQAGRSRGRSGFTLHRSDCPHVTKTNGRTALPAPADPYDGTVPCRRCKPEIIDRSN